MMDDTTTPTPGTEETTVPAETPAETPAEAPATPETAAPEVQAAQ